jgi:hypothetical protein
MISVYTQFYFYALFMYILCIYNKHKFSIIEQIKYNKFADTRCFCCVNNFCDSVSNLIFIIGPYLFQTEFVLGCTIMCVGVGSLYFHLNPTINTLYFDRMPMAISFAIILYRTLNSIFLAGLCILSVEYWKKTNNLIPYTVMQITPLFLFLQYDCGMRTTAYFYIAAKICEVCDRQIYNLTKRTISGHTIKHLLAGYSVNFMLPQMCE